MSKDGSERREYIRIGTELLVSYTVLNTKVENKGVVTRNVSGAGIRLPLKEKCKIGTLIKINLKFPDEKKTVSFDAKVVWITPSNKNKIYPYEAGAAFVNIDFLKRTKISNYVQYLNREHLLKEFFR